MAYLKCEICGHTDPMKPKLWVHHWMQKVLAMVLDQSIHEYLWRDVGMKRTCGACACNPPSNRWKRYS